ncbi:MAG: DUF2066 domain-containing protein [Gammaproteobacteria bacterium]|nr:DUF2066 domain-containing protein [Gammaproteobacteria bacterium]MYK28853.1 DUF2066 domain-containing protein [Gammaproteobacteria bacterium]
MQFKFLTAVAALFGLVVAAGAALATAPGFYEAEVEVADQSAATRRSAARVGLERVLIRLSGTAPLPAEPVLLEALGQPERYYDRYLFVADDRLKLFFTPSALLELIDQAKLPLWPLRRPPAIAWLALEANGVRQIVRGGHPLALALVAEAGRRGFEARLPLMDLRDQLRVQPAVVWGRSSLVLAEASRRYGAAAVLIGRLRQGAGLRPAAGGSWSGEFAYWQGSDEFTLQVNNLDLSQAGAAGAGFLASAMASHDAIPWRPTERRSLVVGGIASPLHYGGLLRYFAGLEYLKAVVVVGLDHDRLDIEVSTRAETGRLLSLLEADGRLAGPAPGAPANHLTWRGADLDRPLASQTVDTP